MKDLVCSRSCSVNMRMNIRNRVSERFLGIVLCQGVFKRVIYDYESDYGKKGEQAHDSTGAVRRRVPVGPASHLQLHQ